MGEFDWLTERPIAHRGLHDAAGGIIENTASAFQAAIDRHYAIECDLQVTADGEAMVHHDAALGRLTQGRGLLTQMTAAELQQVAFKATADRMMTLGELCDLVAGRVTLVLELKSEFDGNGRLVRRVGNVLSRYRGYVAVMSFDPEVVGTLAEAVSTNVPRGIVAERHYRGAEWEGMTWLQRRGMAHLLHFMSSQPQFVAYHVKDLPTLATRIASRIMHRPVLAWTVRTDADRARAARYASQMIFEGFRP